MKAKLKGLKKELDSWKKILEDLRQNNALLKYRLSEIVDNDEDKNFLQLAEYFQNELLLKDEKLKKLLKDLQEINTIIEPRTTPSQNTRESLLKLHDEILQFKKRYLTLSMEFNEKMPANPGY
jgi:hypothetical protein